MSDFSLITHLNLNLIKAVSNKTLIKNPFQTRHTLNRFDPFRDGASRSLLRKLLREC